MSFDKELRLTKNKLEKMLTHISDLVSLFEYLLENKGTLMGATFENIIDLITEYENRGGKRPMTTESIQQAFRFILHPKIKSEPDWNRAFFRMPECYKPVGRVEIFWGACEPGSGHWYPDESPQMTAQEQFDLNVKNGLLCGVCMKATFACQCAVTPKGGLHDG